MIPTDLIGWAIILVFIISIISSSPIVLVYLNSTLKLLNIRLSERQESFLFLL